MIDSKADQNINLDHIDMDEIEEACKDIDEVVHSK